MDKGLLKLLSHRHIQEVGRDLWQYYHDTDKLFLLTSAVTVDLIKDISVEIYPEEPIPDTRKDFIDEHGRSLVDFVEQIVVDSLDMDELEREAQENTDDYLYREECKKGQY